MNTDESLDELVEWYSKIKLGWNIDPSIMRRNCSILRDAISSYRTARKYNEQKAETVHSERLMIINLISQLEWCLSFMIYRGIEPTDIGPHLKELITTARKSVQWPKENAQQTQS